MAKTPEEIREAWKIKQRQARKDHPERIPVIRRRHYVKHREAILATKKAQRAADIDASRAKTNAYYAANAERDRAKAKRWRDNNPQQVKTILKKYKQTHPEMMTHHREARRARENNAPLNDLTPQQWEEIKAAYGYRCVYYGRKMKRLTKDHIVPLSKGGSHTVSNIVPACKSCNSRKGTGAPLRPVQPLLLTVTPKKEQNLGS